MSASAVADPAITSEGSSGRRKNRHRAVPLGNEFRKFHIGMANLEVRKKGKTDELEVTGEPIVYNVRYPVYDMFGEFREQIHSGALAEVMGEIDARLLLNHDGMALARMKSNTLTLEDSPTALRFRATMDARMQLANDFYYAVQRGDMDEMSVGMIVGRDEWGEERIDGEWYETRDIYRLEDLLDVSGVTYAASPTTSIDVAKRMAASMPIESRARLRRLEVALRNGEAKPEELLDCLAELRAGKAISASTAEHVVTAANAINTLLDLAGIDPREVAEGETEEREEEPESETPEETADDGESEEEAEGNEEPRTSGLHLALELRKRRR